VKHLGNTAAAATVSVAAAAFLLLHLVSASAAEGPDTTPPTGLVSGLRSPARGALELSLSAQDPGSGLAGAEASLDGGAAASVQLSGNSVSAVPLSLDTTAVPDGTHQLAVRVSDAAGNSATLVERQIAVRNAPIVTGSRASVTVGVSSHSNPGKGGEKGKGGENGKGKGKGVALQSRVCRAPRLRMRLAKRPLWYTRPKHVPALRFRHRYPYTGRLTCRVDGRRVSAPKGTPIDVFYRVWEITFKRRRGQVKKLRKRPIRVRKGGRIWVRLGGFGSGRTLIFRYRRSDERTRSKLRVAVAPRGHLQPWWRR